MWSGCCLQHCVLECDGKMVKDEDMKSMEESFLVEGKNQILKSEIIHKWKEVEIFN